MYFAASKNLKLKTKKFIVGSEVEFGRSVLTVEKVKNQDRIFTAPKGKRIKALEELRRPANKRDCSVACSLVCSDGTQQLPWRYL